MPDSSLDPTAGYRPKPKGPNFGLIVALACAAFLLILVAAVLLVHFKGTKIDPHGPKPEPNSMVLQIHPNGPLLQRNA
jgi:hypothetical protein